MGTLEHSTEECREETEEGNVLVEPLAARARRSHSQIDLKLRALEGVELGAQMAQLNDVFTRINSLAASLVQSRLFTSAIQAAAEQVRLADSIAASVANGMPAIVPPLLEKWNVVDSILKQTQVAYEAITARYLAPLQDIARQIAQSYRPFLDQISRLQARSLEVELRRYHWWPVPGLPHSFYMGILDLIEQAQARRINRYICNWFRWNRYRRLGWMVRRWHDNDYFRRRRPIYTQALKAHRRGWYNLTVPALIPLLEGIARDYLLKAHGVTERSGRDAIRRAMKLNVPDDVYHEELQQALVRYITSITFQDTARVPPSGHELNRHGVAHSRHLRYGTEANSLRCFLLLETLFQFMSDDPGAIWLPDPDDQPE